jgi:hypothetical protein
MYKHSSDQLTLEFLKSPISKNIQSFIIDRRSRGLSNRTIGYCSYNSVQSNICKGYKESAKSLVK